MVFSSAIFLFLFLPVFLGVFLLTPRRARSIVMTIASYVFYGWWRPDFVFLMLFQSLVDWSIGLVIGREQSRGKSGRTWLWTSIVLNLSLLFYFKYANFGVATANTILERFGANAIPWTTILLPIGISFYTFQSMSYTIDVYWKRVEPTKSLWDFLAFVSMFPQLVAGPIVRYRDVADQFHRPARGFATFAQGVLAFEAGFAKKILIADVLAPLADRAFHGAAPGPSGAWIGALAYTWQIYFDFSGYSDMAIGLGLMLGFRFPINFDAPYRAASITEFWRRWHISLSTWLRDYLYVPLGGNRRGVRRTYVNLALTMLLGGLWHGAAWTFVVWGAWQGLWLIVERARGGKTLVASAPRFAGVLWTLLIVLVGWVFFRAESLGGALAYLKNMSGLGDGPVLWPSRLAITVFMIGAAMIFVCPTTERLVVRPKLAWIILLQAAFFLAILHLLTEDHVPFLYFQF